jgi:hypothetical protein
MVDQTIGDLAPILGKALEMIQPTPTEDVVGVILRG